jgi:hypothetical protein
MTTTAQRVITHLLDQLVDRMPAPDLGDLIEAEYRDSQADYDDGPNHQDYDEDDDQDTEVDA